MNENTGVFLLNKIELNCGERKKRMLSVSVRVGSKRRTKVIIKQCLE